MLFLFVLVQKRGNLIAKDFPLGKKKIAADQEETSRKHKSLRAGIPCFPRYIRVILARPLNTCFASCKHVGVRVYVQSRVGESYKGMTV